MHCSLYAVVFQSFSFKHLHLRDKFIQIIKYMVDSHTGDEIIYYNWRSAKLQFNIIQRETK